MANYVRITENPQYKAEEIFIVMRDFRKGGLNLDNYEEFINLINDLPDIAIRKNEDYKIFDKLDLTNVTEAELSVIFQEALRRSKEASKKCWHPEACYENCSTDKSGKIKITAAHSIQNKGILNRISENGHVMTYRFSSGNFSEKSIGKNLASIFYGFCNTHDAIFMPIETSTYSKSLIQNFLFAYRGFIVAAHKKIEVSQLINYVERSDNDIEANKRIFDDAIKNEKYAVICSDIIELPVFYPIALSSSFYLDYDFDGNLIKHSDKRMEFIFVTLFPEAQKTYFIISYFERDRGLYQNLANQLKRRNSLKSDITMLIAAHVENVYFNPVYYDTFIKEHEDKLDEILSLSQFDIAVIKEGNDISKVHTVTPPNYLNNELGINYFGY